jgi:hypothetical protein
VRLLAVSGVDDAARLCDRLGHPASGEVHAVHVFPPDAGPTARRDGGEALNVVRSRLGARATVRLHRPEGEAVGATEAVVGAGGSLAAALRERGLSVTVV